MLIHGNNAGGGLGGTRRGTCTVHVYMVIMQEGAWVALGGVHIYGNNAGGGLGGTRRGACTVHVYMQEGAWVALGGVHIYGNTAGGGLGGTRRGAPQENIKYSGRVDER